MAANLKAKHMDACNFHLDHMPSKQIAPELAKINRENYKQRPGRAGGAHLDAPFRCFIQWLEEQRGPGAHLITDDGCS